MAAAVAEVVMIDGGGDGGGDSGGDCGGGGAGFIIRQNVILITYLPATTTAMGRRIHG